MATVSMPSSRQARIIRSAISPRLATRIRWYMAARLALLDAEELLSVFDRRAVLDQDRHYLAGTLGRNLVEHLHGLNDANDCLWAHLVADLHEGRRIGARRNVKGADHRTHN